MKIMDKVLIFVILSCSILLGFSFWHIHTNIAPEYVQVFVQGKLVQQFSLDQNGEWDIETESAQYNHLMIIQKSAKITKANCSNQNCVHQKAIYYVGETLVCLPHQILIKITGSKKASTPDSISN
ncbi:protein export element [Clostridia bacterium]|nr:protein export element [Clostridia bacterium]